MTTGTCSKSYKERGVREMMTIEEQLSTAIKMMKIDWQQPEEDCGAVMTGLNYFDEIGASYGYEEVRDWVESNAPHNCDLSDYKIEDFDERHFVAGFWWAAHVWLKHVEGKCATDDPCHFCHKQSSEPV